MSRVEAYELGLLGKSVSVRVLEEDLKWAGGENEERAQ